MYQHLKNQLSSRSRDRLRSWKQKCVDEWIDIRFALDPHNKRRQWQKLVALENPQELFQFAKQEFQISQNPEEILPYLQLMQSRSPKVVGEIGTYMSGNTFLFARSFPNLRTLVAIDLRIKNRRRLRYYTPREIVLYCRDGYSASLETRNWLERSLKGNPFDGLFIDGDHSYEGVRADLLTYAPHVALGGLIAFHDIVPDHFVRFGRPGPFYAGEVYRLWAQLKSRFRTWEFIRAPDQNGAGIGVMEIDSLSPEKLQEIGRLTVNQD